MQQFKTRFDLEQQIFNCWNITNDIDTLFELVLDSDPSKDKIANILLGMKELYDVKFEKLMALFEKLLKEKNL